jgi:hypothetical protein
MVKDGVGRDRDPRVPTASASIVGGSPTSIEEAPWLSYIEALPQVRKVADALDSLRLPAGCRR